jgi:hypothetical protein
MAFLSVWEFFIEKKSNLGKFTLCSYSINIDVIICFILFIATLRTSIQCHNDISVNLDYWSLALHTSDFFICTPPPFPFEILLCCDPITHKL